MSRDETRIVTQTDWDEHLRRRAACATTARVPPAFRRGSVNLATEAAAHLYAGRRRDSNARCGRIPRRSPIARGCSRDIPT